MKAGAKIACFNGLGKFSDKFLQKMLAFHFFSSYLCTRKSGCSAVGSALRSGRRGRAFESPHPDFGRQASFSLAVFSYSSDSLTLSCFRIARSLLAVLAGKR